MTGPCSNCGEDHGRSPKHWRDEKSNLHLFCSDACRAEGVAKYCSTARAPIIDGLKKRIAEVNQEISKGGIVVVMHPPDHARPPAATPKKASRSSEQKDIRKKLATPSESEVSKAIAGRLEDLGAWNTRTQSGMIKTYSGHVMKLCREGTPDRVFAAGLTVWIEVKKPGGVTSDAQARTLAELRNNGSLAYVLDNDADLAFILDGLASNAEKVALIQKLMREVDNDIVARQSGKQ